MGWLAVGVRAGWRSIASVGWQGRDGAWVAGRDLLVRPATAPLYRTAPVPPLQLYNGATNPYFLAAKRLYEVFWSVMRSSILPNLEAAGIQEPKL